MAFIDHIRACNRHDLDAFRPFVVAGHHVGWVHAAMADRLAVRRECFAVTGDRVYLMDAEGTIAARSDAVAEAMAALERDGVVPPPRGESYPVMVSWGDEPLLAIDRAYVPLFGVISIGVHVNGFVRTRDASGGSGLSMWIGRRAGDRIVAPGQLDNIVGGGHGLGLGLHDTLVKEADEEASIPEDLAVTARSVGVVRYTMQVPWPRAAEMPDQTAEPTTAGLKRDILFVYDLELPADFVPVNRDGEVEEFFLWPLETVKARVRDTLDFKFNVPLVLIDFLIRHGAISPDEPDYPDLVAGLRGPDATA